MSNQSEINPTLQLNLSSNQFITVIILFLTFFLCILLLKSLKKIFINKNSTSRSRIDQIPDRTNKAISSKLSSQERKSTSSDNSLFPTYGRVSTKFGKEQQTQTSNGLLADIGKLPSTKTKPLCVPTLCEKMPEISKVQQPYPYFIEKDISSRLFNFNHENDAHDKETCNYVISDSTLTNDYRLGIPVKYSTNKNKRRKRYRYKLVSDRPNSRGYQKSRQQFNQSQKLIEMQGSRLNGRCLSSDDLDSFGRRF